MNVVFERLNDSVELEPSCGSPPGVTLIVLSTVSDVTSLSNLTAHISPRSCRGITSSSVLQQTSNINQVHILLLLAVLWVAEVTDPGPAQRGAGGAAGPPVHGVLGRLPRHLPAQPPRPLHPVDGQLGREAEGQEVNTHGRGLWGAFKWHERQKPVWSTGVFLVA